MKGVIAFLRRTVERVPPPLEWMLEVTNRCNLACPMCFRDKVSFKQRDMDLLFIHNLLKRNEAPTAVWPYGYGEPLMYPALFDVIRYAKDQGITVSISTNGSYLNDTNSRKLIASGLDYLIIAFDGATPQTYHKYRKGSNFYQVKANVERFLELKQTLNSPVHVTLQMIRMADTKGEIAAFRTLWDRKGVDCIRVREDLLKNEDAEPHLFTKRRPHRPCFFLWRGPLFVQAGGTLIPCPYYHGSPPFADLNTQSVDEAWNSPKMRELRQAQVSGDLTKFPLCASCPRYQPQALLAAASFFVNTRWIRRYVPLLERIQQLVGRRFFE